MPLQVGGCFDAGVGVDDGAQGAALVKDGDEAGREGIAGLLLAEEEVADPCETELGPAGGNPAGVGGSRRWRRVEDLDDQSVISEQTARRCPEEGQVVTGQSVGAEQAEPDTINHLGTSSIL